MLNARPCNPDGIALLESIFPNRMGRYLPGNNDHRYRIHIGRGDASNRIGEARATGDDASPNGLGTSRVGVCSVDCSLFVPN